MNDSVKAFLSAWCRRPVTRRKVVEIGTRRWGPNPTHHKEAMPGWEAYLMVDVTPGEDVDLVCDAHELSKHVEPNSVDAVWTSSTFEHLHSPWVAAEEILKVLRPGGIFFVQTHFCFPEHGYPNDYLRFTRMGLEHIFKNGRELVSCYEYDAVLTPKDRAIVWNAAAPSPLNVCISGVK